MRYNRFFIAVGLSVATVLFNIGVSNVLADDDGVVQKKTAEVSIFVRDNCAHCVEEEEFLEDLEDKIGRDININIEHIGNRELYDKFIKITDEFDLIKGTPVTLVGNKIFQGFNHKDTTGEILKRIIVESDEFLNFDDALADPSRIEVISSVMDMGAIGSNKNEIKSSIRIPFIGVTVDISKFSLLGITMILGFVDGFNPCSLWVLIMFITLLLQVGSRRRTWQYAGIFLFTQAMTYYVILMLWFSAWDFIGMSQTVTPIIGVVAIGASIYFFHKWWTWTPTCTVTSLDHKKRISDRIKYLAQQPMTIGVVAGILALAFSVNIVNFACSIGIPQTFTKILQINQLSTLVTQEYMLLYVCMYIMVNIFIVAASVSSAHRMSGMMRYSKVTTLISGLLMLALGLIMLLAPDILSNL